MIAGEDLKAGDTVYIDQDGCVFKCPVRPWSSESPEFWRLRTLHRAALHNLVYTEIASTLTIFGGLLGAITLCSPNEWRYYEPHALHLGPQFQRMGLDISSSFP